MRLGGFLLVLASIVAGGLGAAPSVASVSPNVGDVGGGGEAITILGDDFVNGATVTIGGVSATSVTWVSATEITCVPGAHAAGVVDIVVTNPDTQDSGASGDNLFEYWAPSEETLGLLLMPGDYAVAGAQGVNAVGTWTDSSGNNLDAVSDGGVDAPIASSGCPDFVAADALFLSIAESIADGGTPMATLTAGTIVAILEADIAEADAAAYANPSIIAGNAASPNLQFSDVGIKGVTYDDGVADYITCVAGAAATGVSHIAFLRWNGATFECRRNGGSFVNEPILAATLSAGNVGPQTEIGRSFAGTQHFDGRIKLIAISATAISDALCNKFRTWAQQQGHV